MVLGYPQASLIANREVPGPFTLATVNPATEEVLAEVTALDGEGAHLAVEAALRAFPSWSRTTLRQRQGFLAAWLKVLVKRREELARLVALEGGKPMTEALLVDLFPACETLAYLARQLPCLLQPRPTPPEQILFSHWQAAYRFEPLGVVAIITPWNYPVAIPVVEIAQALACGNTVVFKPASATVLTGLALADTLRQAGLPPGVVNTVVLRGADTHALVEDPRVAKVLFTGSVEVGRQVARRAAERLCPVQLELGGKDAAVVAADAPLERTAYGLVWGALQNTGQTCASIERVYVEKPLFEPLVERVVQLVRTLRVGDPLEPSTDVGPMTTAEQREVVARQVEEAKAGGAQVLTGGYLPEGKGFFYPPTVLVGVQEEMAVMREETFGPVLPLVPVESLEEGIARANASPFGLTASGWTSSKKTARKLVEELSAGVVTINEHVVSFAEPTASWGGVRQSGIGRSHGFFGLLELVNLKYVAESYPRRLSPWYYPYDEDKGNFLRAAFAARYAGTSSKASALWALARTRTFWSRVRRRTLLLHWPRLFR
ncbi:MAG: aldehyde dehydrogenase family protein [Thermoanaerobaculum sp.]|nr:aldehyde dehydrogenase family protein [Thermoanaerobaculum sp.]